MKFSSFTSLKIIKAGNDYGGYRWDLSVFFEVRDFRLRNVF
jgi:hypothetical protein